MRRVRRRRNPLMLAAFFGSIAGLLVLGLGGRVATAALAASSGSAMNLSLPGIMESMLVGIVVGAIGGLLMLVVRRAIPGGARWLRGVVLGAVLFHFTLAFAWFTGGLALRAELPATLIVVAAVFVVYGIVVERMLPTTPERCLAPRNDPMSLPRVRP